MSNKLFFLLFIAFVLKANAQTGYKISLQLKPYKNQYAYLGYHYGKVKALADSVLLDENSKGIFKKDKKLEGGIYFIVSPKKEILFEILIDKEQQFSITADSAIGYDKIKYEGTSDNLMFQEYSNYTGTKGKEINNLLKELANATTKTDSVKIQEALKKDNLDIQQYRLNVEKKYPGAMLTALFNAMEEPVIPPAAKHPKGTYDSLYAYQYFKSHYWDGVAFTDDRLIRTPIFEAKLDKYYKELVVPVPDSINKEIDAMLLKAKPNNEMYKYLLTYFVQQYINPQYMGLDAVYVHLFEKYINNNDEVNWFTEKYRKYMDERAYSLMANLIGKPAQNLLMLDTAGKKQNLYDVTAPFIVVCFWDPTCGHCIEMVPKLDSMYNAKWKKQGIKIFGVMVDGGKDNWVKYIKDKKLDWIHAYQPTEMREADYAAGRPNYRQLYDVYQTPVLYLLDKDKRIIAKKLDYQQLDEVITLKMKKNQ